MTAIKLTSQTRQTIIWIAALLLGALLGLAGKEWINSSADFIAAIYTRLFQFLAVPTIALAVVVTLANFGSQKDTGKIFRHTITYTLLTTVAATLVGLALYLIIQPDNLSAQLIQKSAAPEIAGGESLSYKEHLLSAIPNNVVRPFLEGNVLSILLLAFAVGIALAKTPASDNKEALMKVITALQDLLFRLIRGLIWALPLGIVAFAAQLSAQVTAGVAADSIGKYVAVVLGGNVIQVVVVLPLFLLARGISPLRALKAMYPALLMALFTKSSAATLPVTMSSAENRMKVAPRVSRFVLPICTTINMNGCAAFHLHHLALRDAERRHDAYRKPCRYRAVLRAVGSARRHLCHRQCGRAHGVLFPHPVAHDGHQRTGRHHGHHPAHLYDYRHDRDCRERVVGLMCLRHDRPRPVGKGSIILSRTIANSLNFSKFRS